MSTQTYTTGVQTDRPKDGLQQGDMQIPRLERLDAIGGQSQINLLCIALYFLMFDKLGSLHVFGFISDLTCFTLVAC